MTLNCLVIQNKKIAICPPTKISLIVHHFFSLINRYLVNQIILIVKLNQGSIFSQKIYVLLSGRDWSSYNSILILSLDIHLTWWLDCKYAAIFSDDQNDLLFNHIFKKNHFIAQLI